MKDLECPNCGGSQPTELSAGVFKCKFCGQTFVNEQMIRQKKEHELRMAQMAHQQQIVGQAMQAATGMGKKIMLIVALFLIVIFSIVGYTVYKSVNEATQMQEDIRQDIMKQFPTQQ